MSTGIQPIRTFKPPVVAADLNPGRFIKAESFNGKRVTYKIAAIPEMEELEGKDGKRQVRGIVSFVGVEMKWVLNTTNIVCLTAMFGKVLAGWVGKRVTLFEGQHDNAPAIRVWGSPDIAGEMDVSIALPRRRAYTMTMHQVVLGGKKAAGNGSNGSRAIGSHEANPARETPKAAPQEPAPEAEPETETEDPTGEPDTEKGEEPEAEPDEDHADIPDGDAD